MLWNGKGGIDTSASNPYANVYGGAAASLSTVYVYKYFDPTDTSNSWDNGQDFYVVRYAEVYYLWRRRWYRKEAMFIVM